jgi:chromate reductase
MKTLIISGSARSNNNTLRLAKALNGLISKSEIVDYQNYDLPNFNQLDNYSKTDFHQELEEKMACSDHIIILSPEYNWFPTAELIQTIHLLATPANKVLFDGKLFSCAGVSSGRGGRLPAIYMSQMLDKIFQVFNFLSFTNPNKFEAQFVTKCIDEKGILLDNEEFNIGLKNFVTFAEHLSKKLM